MILEALGWSSVMPSNIHDLISIFGGESLQRGQAADMVCHQQCLWIFGREQNSRVINNVESPFTVLWITFFL